MTGSWLLVYALLLLLHIMLLSVLCLKLFRKNALAVVLLYRMLLA